MEIVDGTVITIHSNVNDAFAAHVERLKAKEEQEKAEREAKWQRDKEERERKEAEFKLAHPNLSKHTYCSYYNYETFSDYYGGYCDIYFYEWSNIGIEPRKFKGYVPFYRFLDDCGLLFTDEQNSFIKPLRECFITCKPGSKDMIVCRTYEGLKKEYEAVMADAAHVTVMV